MRFSVDEAPGVDLVCTYQSIQCVPRWAKYDVAHTGTLDKLCFLPNNSFGI